MNSADLTDFVGFGDPNGKAQLRPV